MVVSRYGNERWKCRERGNEHKASGEQGQREMHETGEGRFESAKQKKEEGPVQQAMSQYIGLLCFIYVLDVCNSTVLVFF